VSSGCMERLIYFCGWDIADRADKKAVVITVELLAGKRCLHRRKVISAFPIFASRINFEGPIWLITLVLNGLMTHFASTLACGLKPCMDGSRGARAFWLMQA
jgi:hypothetical protein